MVVFSETNLRSHFSQYESVLINLPPSDYYEKMVELIEKGNYLQILYGMGSNYVLILLDFFEEMEDYERCAIIRDTIDNHNKISGDNIQNKLLCL